MKSKIAGILILILLVTAILPVYVYGDEEEEPITYTYDSYKKLTEEGKADVKLGSKTLTKGVSATFSLPAAGAGVVGVVLTLPIVIIQGIMNTAINGSAFKQVTIHDIVLNKCDILNANYAEKSSNSINESIRNSVIIMFYAMRVLAIAISLIGLIYIGIRMALSTVTADKVKYKKMIIDWCVSFAIIFVIHYVIVIAMTVSDSIVDFLAKANIDSFESGLFGQVINLMNQNTGWAYIAIVIMYIVMVFYQFRFIYLYVKRFLSIGFLIVISPLITITYAADKSGDGKAQALNNWLREFLGNVFIQPLHAGIYLVFIASANEIFKAAPLLAVIFFAMLSRAEKIFKNIFGLKNMISMRNMSEIMGSGK